MKCANCNHAYEQHPNEGPCSATNTEVVDGKPVSEPCRCAFPMTYEEMFGRLLSQTNEGLALIHKEAREQTVLLRVIAGMLKKKFDEPLIKPFTH